jgi:hypothetical protein
VDPGNLRFAGVTIVKPVRYGTASTITTNALSMQAYMEGTTAYDRFAPTSGTTSHDHPGQRLRRGGRLPTQRIVLRPFEQRDRG